MLLPLPIGPAVFNLSQFSKISLSMLVTLFGIVIFSRLLQPLNAETPILVTLLGIAILSRLVQPLNAEAPILITLFGSVILSRLVQP
jgi:hypothetical protein